MARVGADGIFRRVKVRIWRSGSFSRLSRIEPSGQALWLYLLTCPESCAIPGAIVAGRAQLAEALGWSLEEFDRCYTEVARESMSVADWGSRLVWLPRGPYENPPASLNAVKTWGTVFRTIPDCELKARIYREIRDFMQAYGEGFEDAFADAFGKALPHTLRQGKPLPKRHQGVVVGSSSREEGVVVPPSAATQPFPPNEGGTTATTTDQAPELPPEDSPETEDLPPNPHPEAVPDPEANAHPWDPLDEERYGNPDHLNAHWQDYIETCLARKLPRPWPSFTQWLAEDIKRRGALVVAGEKAIADREAQKDGKTSTAPRSANAQHQT